MTQPLLHLILWCGITLIGRLSGAVAFVSHTTPQLLHSPPLVSSQYSYLALTMAPRYDKQSQQWSPTDPSIEGPDAGYNIIGSLYRAGPVPFIQRIINANSYEQAVLKYMAQEKCDRVTAQGNMDAYLENPQDWAYQKMQEKKNVGVTPKDYANANMQPRQIMLSSVWAIVVIAFGYDLVTGVAEGRYGRPDGNTNDLFHGNLWTLPF